MVAAKAVDMPMAGPPPSLYPDSGFYEPSGSKAPTDPDSAEPRNSMVDAFRVLNTDNNPQQEATMFAVRPTPKIVCCILAALRHI